MRKIFSDNMRQGFQFEVEDNLLFVRNKVTDMYFIIDDHEIKLLEEAIKYLKDEADKPSFCEHGITKAIPCKKCVNHGDGEVDE